MLFGEATLIEKWEIDGKVLYDRNKICGNSDYDNTEHSGVVTILMKD